MLPRLSPIEAQRAAAILEETLEKLSFLGSIAPDVLAHRDELSQFVGDEISRIIEEQRQLEKRYEELITRRGELKGLANKTRYLNNQREIQEVSRALRESTKKLCRNLKENPNIGGNLTKIQAEREQLEKLLRATVSELRDNTFATLVRQVEDDRREQENLAKLIESERQMSNAVKQLSDDLSRERSEHQREVTERKKKIAELKEQLHEKRATTTVKTKFERKQAVAKTNAVRRQFELEERELQQRLEDLRRRKDLEAKVHEDTVAFLRAEQQRLQDQIQEWTVRRDREVEAKQQELERVTEAREEDLRRLTALQERHEREEAEEEARKAEEARLAELRRLEMMEKRKQNAAALRIQNGFRLFKQKAAEQAAASKTTKGGKKKGGKKKK